MIHDARDRITDGLNRERLRIEIKRALPSIPVIVIGVLATLAGAAVLFSQLSPTLFKSTREVRVEIDDAYGILEGVDDVRYRGVPAGTIQKIERDGTQLVLRASLEKDLPVYRDAKLELRPETPLNDQYLDVVDPGTPGAGELQGDEPLPESRTETNVKINDVLNTLNADTRTRLSQLLDNLGNGLQDRGAALDAAVESFIPFVAAAGDITEVVGDRERMTQRLIKNARILTTELGTRETEVRKLVRDGTATLGALQEGSGDLDATLAELPSSVGEINATLAAVRGVVGDVDRAVTDLGPVADRVPAALVTADKLNAALSPAVRRLQSPVRKLNPFALALRPVAGNAKITVDALNARLRSIDKVTTSLAKCEKAFVHFWQWNASLSKFGDRRAPIPRGTLGAQVPDSGFTGTTRKPVENCAGGNTISGRLPTSGDEG